MRFRFENRNQIFELRSGDIAILPIDELKKLSSENEVDWDRYWAEIPALVYPCDEEKLVKALEGLKALGLKHVICENISAVVYARQLGLIMHGGLFLNVLNSNAADEYKALGFKDLTYSMELSFANMRKIKTEIPCGICVYGYLPLMKFRACPKKGPMGCGNCSGLSKLKDRLGEEFPLICRNKRYSELLNCVPLYVGDKQIPPSDFIMLYFTVESREQAFDIRTMVMTRSTADFRKTGGLYHRELL